MKAVGKRRSTQALKPDSSEEALQRAAVLQAQTKLLNP